MADRVLCKAGAQQCALPFFFQMRGHALRLIWASLIRVEEWISRRGRLSSSCLLCFPVSAAILGDFAPPLERKGVYKASP